MLTLFSPESVSYRSLLAEPVSGGDLPGKKTLADFLLTLRGILKR